MTRVLPLLACLAALALAGCFGPDRELRAEPVPGEKDRAERVLIIDIAGAIESHAEHGVLGAGGCGADQVIERLRKARHDGSIKAVVLAIDSPGGDVTASDAIHHEVLRLRASGMPVIAHLGGLAASGGYYVACACDRIVAAPTTITGSIGVIFQSPDAHELLEGKLGVHLNTIKSGAYKDIGSPARAMTDDERKLLQAMIDRMYARFVAVVVAGRHGRGPIPDEHAAAEQAVRTLADGRVFTGEEALANGLADQTGQLMDAVDAARKAAGAKKVGVVRYERDEVVYSLVSGRSEVNVNNGVQLQANALRLASPRMQYLWAPGL